MSEPFPDAVVSVNASEYRALRELRATCLDAPLETGLIVEKLRGMLYPDRHILAPLADDLQRYALRLKQMAEGAR